jgi:hypothetical protein
MNLIPLSVLRDACAKQLGLVKAEWPGGIPLTQEAVKRAVELELDIDWLASNLLRPVTYAEYAQVREKADAEYEKAEQSAYAKYEKVIGLKLLALLRLKKNWK